MSLLLGALAAAALVFMVGVLRELGKIRALLEARRDHQEPQP